MGKRRLLCRALISFRGLTWLRGDHVELLEDIQKELKKPPKRKSVKEACDGIKKKVQQLIGDGYVVEVRELLELMKLRETIKSPTTKIMGTAFTAAEDIEAGTPVQLNAEGKVEPCPEEKEKVDPCVGCHFCMGFDSCNRGAAPALARERGKCASREGKEPLCDTCSNEYCIVVRNGIVSTTQKTTHCNHYIRGKVDFLSQVAHPVACVHCGRLPSVFNDRPGVWHSCGKPKCICGGDTVQNWNALQFELAREKR